MAGREGARAGWGVLVRMTGRLARLPTLRSGTVAGKVVMMGTDRLRWQNWFRAVALEADTMAGREGVRVGLGWFFAERSGMVALEADTMTVSVEVRAG